MCCTVSLYNKKKKKFLLSKMSLRLLHFGSSAQCFVDVPRAAERGGGAVDGNRKYVSCCGSVSTVT